MKFLRKRVRQQWYPYSVCGSPHDIMYIGSMRSPLIPDAEKKTIFAALLLAEFKNRYVTANINLK